ncbi:MAG: M48 family metalloprotease [Kiloniellaceae bacterium]
MVWRPKRLRPAAAAGLLLFALSACGVTDDVVCLDSYCASQEGGRYIDHLQFDAASYKPEPTLRQENVRSVRTVNKGLFQHDPLQSYAEAILDRIVAAGPASQARPDLVIAANNSLNAQCLPGGVIVIHHSLFKYLDNEEQFAFILSHEYAHYLLDHFSFFDRLRPYALTAAELVVSLQSEGDNDDWRQLLKVYGSDILARDLLYPAWSRRKEDEADRLGVDLMARAGYNPAGAQEFLEILSDYEAAVGRHAEVELNKLEAELAIKFGDEDPDSPVDQRTGKVDLSGFLFKKGYQAFRNMQQTFSARHEEAAQRAAAVLAYVERDYEDESFRDRPTAGWTRAVTASRTVLASYDAAFDVISALESEDVSPPDLTRLASKARQAVTGPTESDSYTRLAFFELRLKQRKFDLAERNLDVALEKDPQPSFQIIQGKAKILEEQGDPKAAFDLLDQQSDQYDWPLSTYLTMLRLAPQVGQQNRRFDLVTSCAFKYPQSQFACRSVK